MWTTDSDKSLRGAIEHWARRSASAARHSAPFHPYRPGIHFRGLSLSPSGFSPSFYLKKDVHYENIFPLLQTKVFLLSLNFNNIFIMMYEVCYDQKVFLIFVREQ